MRLILIDFVLAFAVVWIAVFAVGVARDRAHAAGVASIGAAVRTMAGANLASADAAAPNMVNPAHKRADTPRLQTYLLLSLWVAALAALNLAFWRHLRRAYASPRRSMWKRG